MNRERVLRLVAAVCLVLSAGAAPAEARGPDISDPEGAPIGIPMSRDSVVRELAEYSKRFVCERGQAAAAAVFRRFDASGVWNGSRQYASPEFRARWLSDAPVDDIVRSFEWDTGFMTASSYALFAEQFGIEFHYIVNTNGAEGKVLQCPYLAEVIAQLLHYPDVMLEYVGHAAPKLRAYLYAHGISPPCPWGGDACASGGAIFLKDASPTVHETAHAIQSIALEDNQADPSNPLKGAKAEFDAVFSIPPKYAGMAAYSDFYGPGGDPWGPLDETPPGFIDQYSMVNDWENFAQTCTYYVGSPDEYLTAAYAQAWDEEIALCQKYRFAFQRVFLCEEFSELSAPGSAVVDLHPVDKGDGDGRIEPGELFALDLRIVPLDDYPSATYLHCKPSEPTMSVLCLATSTFAGGLAKGVRYEFPSAFNYRLHASFQGESNRTFALQCHTKSVAQTTLGYDSIPLNENGALWGWALKDGSEDDTLVRLTSTMRKTESVRLRPALTALLENNAGMVYDAATDCFWSAQTGTDGSILRIPRKTPGAYTAYPVNPGGRLAGCEVVSMSLNPADGALWFCTDESEVVRFVVGADGKATRKVLYPEAMSAVPWTTTGHLSVDPASGKVWLASEGALMRLSPSGAPEWSVAVPEVHLLSPAPDGGCWIKSGAKQAASLTKISPYGALQFTKIAGIDIGQIVCHPSDGTLWAIGKGASLHDRKLLCYSTSGALLSVRQMDPGVGNVIPCSSDTTVFVNIYSLNLPRVARYAVYGDPLYPAHEDSCGYRAFWYQSMSK